MSEPAPQPELPRRRRARYRGTHPRSYREKYKEHAPELYPGIVDAVRARGMTPAGQHVSILVEEVLAVLAPRAGEHGVDCTLGFGGHARRLLERLAPGGVLLALDADPLVLPRTEASLRAEGHAPASLVVRRTNFAALRGALFELGWNDGADFVFADLGVSSMQIDDPGRGFSFKSDAPLDMRMNPARGLSAAQWLERVEEGELARVLREHADEPRAERIAAALLARRGRLRSTVELAAAVRAALPAGADDDEAERSVRRVFQAVRIEVNDELGVLEQLLGALPQCLKSGGRAAILSFHSGEDRRVKRAFESGHASGAYARISAEALRASAAERRDNPRAAPAKLRWALRA